MSEAPSSDTARPRVAVARILLDAGRLPLAERAEVREGGLNVSRETLLELVAGSTAIVADPTIPVDAELLDAAGPSLRLVANFAVGYDNVDLAACREREVAVSNTPDVLSDTTAELALALTLGVARRLGAAEQDLRAGRWRGLAPGDYLGKQLTGAAFGVIGMGRIGARYAELVRPMAGRILYSGPSPKPDADRRLGAEYLPLADLLAEADVVSLHAPASPETASLIGAAELERMKPGALLVNTARGSLIDEPALVAALRSESIGGAGLDVFANEPSVAPELLAAPHCVVLPHIGSATHAARDAMARLVAENVVAVLDGRRPPSEVG
jgi:glyoxylate reductase